MAFALLSSRRVQNSCSSELLGRFSPVAGCPASHVSLIFRGLKPRRPLRVSLGGLRARSLVSLQPPYCPTSGLAFLVEVGYEGLIWACSGLLSPKRPHKLTAQVPVSAISACERSGLCSNEDIFSLGRT